MCGVTHLWILLQQNYSDSFWHLVRSLRIFSTKLWHYLFGWVGTSVAEEAAGSIFYHAVSCSPVVHAFIYQTTQLHIPEDCNLDSVPWEHWISEEKWKYRQKLHLALNYAKVLQYSFVAHWWPFYVHSIMFPSGCATAHRKGEGPDWSCWLTVFL